MFAVIVVANVCCSFVWLSKVEFLIIVVVIVFLLFIWALGCVDVLYVCRFCVGGRVSCYVVVL